MAVRHKQRPDLTITNRIDEAEWLKTFPAKLDTEKRSMRFMKQVLGIGVSTILRLRDIFPKECFGNKKLADVHLKILHGVDKPSRLMIQGLAGCFNALEKKYLREARLGVYENADDSETVVEDYTFCFDYDAEGLPSMSMNSGENKTGWLSKVQYRGEGHVKKATRDVMRRLTLLITQMEPLPNSAYVSMKINYYDERTPLDYQPPGFVSADSDKFLFPAGKVPLSITVGRIVTKHHGVKMKVQTLYLEPEEDDESEHEEGNSREKVQFTNFVPANLVRRRSLSDKDAVDFMRKELKRTEELMKASDFD